MIFDKPYERIVQEGEQEEAIDLDKLNTAPPRSGLGFFQGLSLVIGLQIGSGIFSSPNQIHIHAGSIGASLIVWVVSGLLAWTGASCYAELGSAIPRSGGAKAYLQYIYGDYVAYLFSWAALTVIKPGGAAIIASVLGEYVSKDQIIKRAVAVAAIVVTVIANWLGIGATASTFFLVLKFVLLVGVLVASIVLTTKRDLSTESLWGGTRSFGELIVGLYGGIWAYDGWDNLNFVAGEMRNPTRDLPRVIAVSMPLVIVAYLIVNLGYFGALSSTDLDASTSVALTIAEQLHSKVLAIVLSGGIVLSCAGALNAAIFSIAKLVQIVAEDNVLPKALTKHGYALLFQGVLTAGYVCIGEFKSLVQFYGAMGCLFYAIVVCGLLRLRWTEPNLDRPYRTWLIAPIIFIVLSITLLLRTVIALPLVLPATVGFFLLGSPLFWLSRRSAANEESKDNAQSNQTEDVVQENDFEHDSEYEI